MSAGSMKERLEKIKLEAEAALAKADSTSSLEKVRLSYLGQKAELTTILRNLATLAEGERRQVGKLANQVKAEIQLLISSRHGSLYRQEVEEKLAGDTIDVTLPGTSTLRGHRHPLTQVLDEVVEIFFGMGFSIVEGPEVETDYYNFDALNTPPDHPARDEQDTFYTDVGPAVVLRSQTSPVQIRAMEGGSPPFRLIAPGRVYRNEEVNPRKYPLFHQIEGLLVDRDVTFGQLKGTLNEFIRLFFGKKVETRFRPDFFPFTEPSAELDSQCPFCMGSGCHTCGQRGWLELLGCGMVDPNVLETVGVDPERWSGYAFGAGLERLAMLKYGIGDIRLFFTSDLRFIEQF